MKNYQVFIFYKSLMILAYFYIFSLTANATTYYVTTSGNNGNGGTTEGLAWRTITYAATQALAGDTVYIKAGNYGAENVSLSNNGTAGNLITFEGYKSTPGDITTPYSYTRDDVIAGTAFDSSEMPMLQGSSRSTAGTAITLNGKDYIVIKNLFIDQYTDAIPGGGAYTNHCVFENIVMKEIGDPDTDYSGVGIKANGIDNIIRNCVVANAAMEAIMIRYGANTVEDCQVYCNQGTLVGGESEEEKDALSRLATDYYIVIGGYNSGGDYSTVSNCYVERIGNLAHPGHGICIKGDCEYNLLKNNVLINTGHDLAHRGCRYNIIENDIVIATDEIGPATNGFGLRDGANHNTIKNCRATTIDRGILFADCTEDEGEQYAASDNTFVNCIFDNTVEPMICHYSDGGDWYDSSAYNNSFMNCTFSNSDYLFDARAESANNNFINCIFDNISNLKTGSYSLGYSYCYSDFYNSFSTPAGAGNFSSNPLFIDASNGDYRLKANSPCIDAGISSYGGINAPDFDYNYLIRPQGYGYDVGAHEYNFDNPLLYVNFNTGLPIDEMGNISNGTKHGTTAYEGALYFDGTDDYVDFGTSEILDVTSNCNRSISAWVKPYSNGLYRTIAAKYIYGWGLWLLNGKLKAQVQGSTSAASSLSSTLVSLNEWHHVAMVFYPSTKKIRLYLDGTEVDYIAQTAMVGDPVTYPDSSFTIGADYNGGPRYFFHGCIDEVKVFKRVLDAFEEYSTALSVNFNEIINDKIVNGNVIVASLVNNGTICGGATGVTGISGDALSFDGTDDYVDFGTVPALDLTGDRSISAWVKPESSGTQVIASKYMYGWGLWLYNRKIKAQVDGSTSDASSLSSTLLSLDEWHHVVMTFDNTTKEISLYLDGTEVDYVAQTAMVGNPVTHPNCPFTIGADYNGGPRYFFDGIIDEVKLYHKALTPGEISDLYDEYQ